MISIFPIKKDKEEMETPQKSFWHWLTPVLVSVGVTAATILVAAGGMSARLSAVETKADKLDGQLERRFDQFNTSLEKLATKEDLKEFKQDIKERVDRRR